MSTTLLPSAHLAEVPPIDFDTAVTLKHDDDYPDWKAVFERNLDTAHFLLLPGDYRRWGRMIIDRPGRPSTIRYYNPDADEDFHPVRRREAARIESFRFTGAQTRDWTLHGLTICRPATNPDLEQGPSNITIDACLIQYAETYSLRIRAATNVTVQRCVIRESIRCKEPQDTVGIQVGNIRADVTGIRILDNEIYNVGDGIQLTDGPEPARPVEVLIEGNDIYLKPSRYIDETGTTWDENAIDLKAGSDVGESTVIHDNRMWGFRRNAAPTALGELIVVQRQARNIVIEKNILGDAPHALKDENWKDEPDPDRPRNVVVRDNQIYGINGYAALDASAVFRPITAGITFTGNHIARCGYLADATPPAYRGAGPVFTGNVLAEVSAVQRPEGHPSLHLRPADNNTFVSAPAGYDQYERRRWTGPESAAGAIPSPLADGGQPVIAVISC